MSQFIKNFQAANGLSADGIIGRNTLLKIKELYKVPSKEGLSHFVANTYHETGGFKVFEENLNYSAERLVVVFKKYFPTLVEAKKYEYKPQLIAEKVYGGRLGNVLPGDGWKFRGRGAIMTTGRSNYEKLSECIGVDLTCDPDLVLTKHALDSAVYFFACNKIWDIANTVDDNSIRVVRKKVQGGALGLSEVSKKVKEYYNILK